MSKKITKKKGKSDLTKLVSIQNDDIEVKSVPYKSGKKTPEEIAESLIGYEEVSKYQWKDIPEGSHIRYLRKDGSFRGGGTVRGVWQTKSSSGTDIIQIELVSNSSYKPTTWRINLDDIEKIWKRIEKHITREQSYNNELSPEIETRLSYCEKAIKNLLTEIQRLSNDNMRILTLIKKLHPNL